MKPISELSQKARVTWQTLQSLLITAMLGFVLLAASGKPDWSQAWIFIMVYGLCNWISSFLLFTKAPELLDARRKKHNDIRKRDKMLIILYQAMYFPTLIIPGIEQRLNPLDVPPAANAAFILIILSFVLITWAPLVNRHLETYIRIQTDRDHQVCTQGPYRFMRHPAYLGLILLFVGMPLSLGSLWGLVPAGFACLFIILRTKMEDRILQAELKGYIEYSKQTRYRLFPGIW
jgi:protein-S-isoprenylcysteine O-methyltransferase Ste14